MRRTILTIIANRNVKMLLKYEQVFVLIVWMIRITFGCYSKEETSFANPELLVPTDHPTRMLGWEQMVLMFPNYPKIAVIVIHIRDFVLCFSL